MKMWQSSDHQGWIVSAAPATVAHMATPAHTHHALDYVEFGVADFDAAKAFYGAAFGWTFTDYGPGPAYVGIRDVRTSEDIEVGGASTSRTPAATSLQSGRHPE